MTTRRLGIALSAWSAAFACVHLAWALGWRGGVPDDVAPIGERPVFWAYDVVAGVLMLLAAGVAAALACGGLPHRSRRLLLTLTLVGALLALARGLPTLVWDLGSVDLTGLGPAVDAWFTVAGLLGLALWLVAGAPDQARSLSSKKASTRSTPSC